GDPHEGGHRPDGLGAVVHRSTLSTGWSGLSRSLERVPTAGQSDALQQVSAVFIRGPATPRIRGLESRAKREGWGRGRRASARSGRGKNLSPPTLGLARTPEARPEAGSSVDADDPVCLGGAESLCHQGTVRRSLLQEFLGDRCPTAALGWTGGLPSKAREGLHSCGHCGAPRRVRFKRWPHPRPQNLSEANLSPGAPL